MPTQTPSTITLAQPVRIINATPQSWSTSDYIAAWALAFSILYTLITGWIMWLTRETLRVQQANAALTFRPYLSFESIMLEGALNQQLQGALRFRLHLRNAGSVMTSYRMHQLKVNYPNGQAGHAWEPSKPATVFPGQTTTHFTPWTQNLQLPGQVFPVVIEYYLTYSSPADGREFISKKRFEVDVDLTGRSDLPWVYLDQEDT